MSSEVQVPTEATLKKYGLTAHDWQAIFELEGRVCPIMNAPSGTGRYVIDHEHVRGWKKMPPEERRQYVRGIVSWFANHAYLGRGISVERALRVALYLAKYEGHVGLVNVLERLLVDHENEGGWH